MRVLGLDPGMAVMGYGVVESGEEPRMTDCGVLTCSSHTPMIDRLRLLYDGLIQIIAQYQPDEVTIEEPFVAKNARTALAVGRAQAVAILAAANNNLPIYTYTPAQVKQVATNYGDSGKEQVQEMVKIQLGLPKAPQPSDAADALAIAICHLRQRQVAKLVAECYEE